MNLRPGYQPHSVIGKNKIEVARCLCFSEIGVSNNEGLLNLKEPDLGFFRSLSPSKDSPLLGPVGEGVMSTSHLTTEGLLRIDGGKLAKKEKEWLLFLGCWPLEEITQNAQERSLGHLRCNRG